MGTTRLDVDRMTESSASWRGMLNQVFLQSEAGRVVAIMAAHPGAGTSFIASLLVDSLNRDSSGSAQLLSLADLFTYRPETQRDTTSQINWKNSADFRRDTIDELRKRVRYTVLDCPSLHVSSEVFSLALLVDGTLLVVEANKTTARQIFRLQDSVEQARGKVSGMILNKRTYPIPKALHRFLEKRGS